MWVSSDADAVRWHKPSEIARPGAVQGEFFTAATSAQFQLVLASLMDAKMWAVIMDENPGAFGHDIDGTYPEGKTFSTVPGLVLAQLPELPDDIQFRFVGRHLILYDVQGEHDHRPDARRDPVHQLRLNEVGGQHV